MNQFNAIYKRKSIRKYQLDELPVGLLYEIKEEVRNLDKLYDEIEMDVHLAEGNKIQNILGGIIGSYGKIMAPYYLVITSKREEGYLENVGYALENIVLKLTTMGIGTCWIGGSINKALLSNIIKIKGNHIPVILISIGYPMDGNDLTKKIIGGKRKDLSEIVIGDISKTWQLIFDAVKWAPSAVNSQPWRFFVQKGRVDMYIKNPNILLKKSLQDMNRIDAGIALSHLKIAANEYGKEVEFIRNLQEKKDHVYITSFKI